MTSMLSYHDRAELKRLGIFANLILIWPQSSRSVGSCNTKVIITNGRVRRVPH